MRLGKKLNKYERKLANAEKLKVALSGSGVYLYENNTKADLTLPKPTDSGIRVLGPGKRFNGDSYYLSWVGNPNNFLRLIEVITPKSQINQQIIKETPMAVEKLILDQPDKITQNGKVEYVVKTPGTVQLNDNNHQVQAKNPEVLLTEDPLDGVEIILG